MELARVTAKGQATIPKRIREAAHIREGDMLAFDLDSNNRIIIKRIEPAINIELLALQETLSEWNSLQDDEAWRDLLRIPRSFCHRFHAHSATHSTDILPLIPR